MTFLETKLRQTSRKKANWNKPHRKCLFEQRLEASKSVELLQTNRSRSRNYNAKKTNGKIEIDATTLAVIQVTVRNLLESSPYTVNVRALGNCLKGSRHVLDVHAQAKMSDVLLLKDNNNKPRGLFGSFLTKEFWNRRNSSNNRMDPSVQRKYDLMHCFRQLEEQSDATRRHIHSWEDALDALQTVLIILPPPQPSTEETTTTKEEELQSVDANAATTTDTNENAITQTNNKDNKNESTIMADFQKRLQDIKLDDTIVGLRSSQHIWQEILAQSPLYQKRQESIRLEQQQLEQAEAAVEQARHAELQKLQQLQEQRDREQAARQRAASLLRELSDEELQRIRDAMRRGGPEDVLAQHDQDTCLRQSLQTLQPGTWLNDEVIHFFLCMLAVRDEQLCQQDPKRKRSHFFKSFFITKLSNEYDALNPGQYSYKNVKRWSKKVPGTLLLCFALFDHYFILLLLSFLMMHLFVS